jgi:type IV pilus assembly protein PilY1
MMKLIYLFSLVLLGSYTSISNADDTEIYGTTEIDRENQVKSNVLFIMDTSGSMGEKVSITLEAYDPNKTYSGSYNSSRYYDSYYISPYYYYTTSQLTSGSSTDCAGVISTIASTGKSNVYIQQYRSNRWRTPYPWQSGSLRCDKGSARILYNGNYLNWQNSDATVESNRLNVVRDVVINLADSLSDINLGLMRFDRDGDGGMIDVPVGPIETTAPLIKSKLNSYSANGGTPLEETMYEAARYYRGDDWYFGSSSSPNDSVNDSLKDSNTYDTPITATCQKNHIILLTDGEPTGDTSANSRVRSWLSSSGLSMPSGLSSSCSGDGECLDELAYFLQNDDQASDQIGDQGITTYTIGGFNLANGVELLKRTANWGGGAYYAADDTEGLTKALDSIFLDILSTNTTFTAPAVSVNAFNASEHRDELFYALFRPEENAFWPGNLKKYRLTSDGIVVDKNGVTAISGSSGFFNDGIYDYWNATTVADGDDIKLGGFANLLDSTARTVYSHNDAGSIALLSSVATKALYNMESDSDADFTKILNWTLGYDVDDEDGDGKSLDDTRYAVSDPLHSEPLIVTYGGSDASPDATLFFGTNEGYIHAIDANTGSETFAFMPQVLMQNQKTFYNNNTPASERPYGMDGQITTWINDKNDNNIVLNGGSVEAGEHVYIYAGMRRGGRNYYALDVTKRNAPSLLFTIEGGSGNYAKLGQTWAKAIVTKAKIGGNEKVVLLISGGYDEDQDNNNTREDDDVGNAIYMVDAETGERLWWASNSGANTNIPEMKNSIPASVTAVDINSDELVDYLFAVDTGGRVFRIDFDNSAASASTFAKGGIIADLSGSSKTENRRFYNQPSVSLVKDKRVGDYLSIAVGSGHRAHPIFTTDVENRMYVLRDRYPYKAPATYTKLTEADESYLGADLASDDAVDNTKVYNASVLMTGGKAVLTNEIYRLMTEGGGYYITLDIEGEKVLSRAMTFGGAILFTTFAPTGSTSSECGPDTGQSRFYAIDQKWGVPVLDLDNDGTIDTDDASTTLAHAGIAPRPVVIYREDGKKTIAIGTETIEDHRYDPDSNVQDNVGFGNASAQKCDPQLCNVIPTYWRTNPKDFSHEETQDEDN